MKRDLQVEYNSLKRQLALSISRKRKRAKILVEEIALEKDVLKILEKIGVLFSGKMSGIINVGLQAVYSEDMEFVRKMGDKSPTIGGFLLSKGHGRGMAEMVAVLLRFIAIKKTLGGSMQTLILDESLSGIDAHIAPRVMAFMKMLSVRMGINVILMTHRMDLTEGADLTYQFSKVKGKTPKEGRTVVKLIRGGRQKVLEVMGE